MKGIIYQYIIIKYYILIFVVVFSGWRERQDCSCVRCGEKGSSKASGGQDCPQNCTLG